MVGANLNFNGILMFLSAIESQGKLENRSWSHAKLAVAVTYMEKTNFLDCLNYLDMQGVIS